MWRVVACDQNLVYLERRRYTLGTRDECQQQPSSLQDTAVLLNPVLVGKFHGTSSRCN